MADLRFHNNTKNVDAHERLKLFFDIMEHIRTGDIPQIELDARLKQLSFSEKGVALSFFQNIIDQPAYMTADHKRLRSMILDWYSSHKTLATQSQQYNDPYNLSSDALDELIRSLTSIQYVVDKDTKNIKIHGKYDHICEALKRAAWLVKSKGLNIIAFC